MIIFGTPKNLNDFIKVSNDEVVLRLHEKGYIPSYKDFSGVYFIKSKEIEKYIMEVM